MGKMDQDLLGLSNVLATCSYHVYLSGLGLQNYENLDGGNALGPRLRTYCVEAGPES